MGPTPPKRRKLSPRAPMSSPTNKQTSFIHSKMLTPIVQRKNSMTDYSVNKSLNVGTPQSILKVIYILLYDR